MTEAQLKNLKRLLTDTLGDIGRLNTKDAIAQMRGVRGFFTDEGYARASEIYEEKLFTRVLRTIEAEGKQVYHHVAREDDKGNVTHEYVQLPLLTLEESRNVGQYRLNMVLRHMRVLKDIAAEHKAQHRTRLPIQLSLLEEELDSLKPLVKKPRATRAELPSGKRRERQLELEV